MGIFENFFKTPFTNINKVELDQLLKEKSKYQFVDVRTKGEYAQKKIKGFNINVDYYQFMRNQNMLNRIKKDKPVVLICQTGARSRSASKLLTKLGYTDVYNVRGGILTYFR